MEDHVGRHVLLLGQGQATLAQGLPQRLIASGDLPLTTLPAGLWRGFLREIAAQRYRFLAAQQRTAHHRKLERTVAGNVNLEVAARDQLTKDRAPLRIIQLRADTEGG